MSSPAVCQNTLLASAASTVYEALASALLDIPRSAVMANVRNVAQLIGYQDYEVFSLDANSETLFFDRFVVSSTDRYLPLWESSISTATIADVITYGPLSVSRRMHVHACYEQIGFDPRKLRGHALIIELFPFDALAYELAFMAAARSLQANADSPENWQKFADSFLQQHLISWVEKAAQIAKLKGDDVFAHLIQLSADWVTLDAASLVVD